MDFLLSPNIELPLQLAMSQGAGVMRSETSLNETASVLTQLGERTSTEPSLESWEASNLYLLATAIVRSALERKETRGSHWRTDYPESSDSWRIRIIQELDRNGNWRTRSEEVK